MNEEMKIKNVLYNYYAISRFELEKYQDSKDSDEYLVNYYAENVIKDLLNNCFCLPLYENACKLLHYLNRLDSSSFTEEERKLQSNLADCIEYFDNRLLRKDDPIDLVFKALMVYLKQYREYQINNNEEVLKHRYDIIYNELIKDEYIASLLIKMAIHLTNNCSNVVVKMRRAYKYSVLTEAINEIKNMYYSMLISLLFKDDKAIKVRLGYLFNYVNVILKAMNKFEDNRELILELNKYSDIYYSHKHNIKIVDDNEAYYHAFGFLSNEEIEDINRELSILDKDVRTCIQELNKKAICLYEQLANRFELEDITNIKQVLEDINTLLQEI